IGVLVAYIQFSGMFFRPLQDLSDKFNIIQAAMASSERIFDLIDTPEKITDSANATGFESPIRGDVEFKDVWFAYDEDEWVLRGLDFTIEAGESVAFVVHTGAGKGTLSHRGTRVSQQQKGGAFLDV